MRGGTPYDSDGVFWTLTVVIECKSPKGKPWVALLVPQTISGSLSVALVEPDSPGRDTLERLLVAGNFSPFAFAACAEGLVSAHVSDGRDQKMTTTPLAPRSVKRSAPQRGSTNSTSRRESSTS